MKKAIFSMSLAVSFAFIATTVMADPGPYNPQCADTNGGTYSACEAGNGFDIFNAVNAVLDRHGPGDPGYTTNEETDVHQVTTANEFWKQLSTEDSSEFAFISITAANSNQLGVFPAGGTAAANSTFFNLSFTGNQFTGDGSIGDPYPGFVNPLADENFGFSLNSIAAGFGGDHIFSSVVDQNPDVTDPIDHMLAFELEELAGETIYVKIDGNNDGDLLDAEDVVVEVTLTEETFLLAWEDKRSAVSGFDADYNDAIYLVAKVQPTIVPEPLTMVLFGGGMAGLAATRKRKIS